MALGAPAHVVGLIVRQAMVLVAAGVAAHHRALWSRRRSSKMLFSVARPTR